MTPIVSPRPPLLPYLTGNRAPAAARPVSVPGVHGHRRRCAMSVVLITGCSSGIGLETALAFARRGDTTYASVRRPPRAGGLLGRAAAEDLLLDVLALDVTDDTSVRSAVSAIEDRHGAIDVLVNNAGLNAAGPVEMLPMDRARALVETNLWGPVRLSRAVLPAMRARGEGVILNIGSLAGRLPAAPYGGFYAASKHALGALSESMSRELAPFGIRVHCIEPGFVMTEMFAKAWSDPPGFGRYDADYRRMRSATAEQRARRGADPAA